MNLQAYHRDLEILAIVRLLEHLSSVYDKFTIPNFAQLISTTSISFDEVETIIARQCSQMSGSINVQIDHHDQTLNFHSGGPEGDRVHAQLATLSSRLQEVVADIEVPESRQSRSNNRVEFFSEIRKRAKVENSTVQGRQEIIEQLKHEKEKQKYIIKQQLAADAKAAKMKNAAAIKATLEQQKRQREERREALAQIEETRKAVKTYAVLQLGAEKAKDLVKKFGNNMSRENVDKAMMDVQQKKEKEDDLQHKKKHALRRHLDYSTRAVREAEIPKLQEYYKQVADARVKQIRERITKEYANKYSHWQEMHAKKQLVKHIAVHLGQFHSELMRARWTEMSAARRESNRIKRAEARMRKAKDDQAERRLRAIQQAQEEAEERRRAEEEAAAAEEALRQQQAEEALREQRRAEEQRTRSAYVPPTMRNTFGSSNTGGMGNGSFSQSSRFSRPDGDRFGASGSSGRYQPPRYGDRYPSDRQSRFGGDRHRDRETVRERPAEERWR